MTVRAKFKLFSVKTQEGTWQGKPAILASYEFYPVYANSPENKLFWEASPSGKIEISVVNPEALKELTVGREYFVDFTEASEV